MRTFEEQLIFDVTGIKTEMYENYQNLTVDKTELTKIIHMAYNQALEDAAENAYKTPNNGLVKKSILKLKKDVSKSV